MCFSGCTEVAQVGIVCDCQIMSSDVNNSDMISRDMHVFSVLQTLPEVLWRSCHENVLLYSEAQTVALCLLPLIESL